MRKLIKLKTLKSCLRLLLEDCCLKNVFKKYNSKSPENSLKELTEKSP